MPPKSFARHEERIQQAKSRASQTNQIVTNSQTRYITTTIQTPAGMTSVSSPMPLPPQPLSFLAPPAPSLPTTSLEDIPEETVNDSSPKKPTQTSETLHEFLTNVPRLLDLLFDHATDQTVGGICSCTSVDAIRTTRCYDCINYQPSCIDCYIRAHQNLPLHWAEVWDFQQGFFVRRDMATLKPDISSINLGHSGQPCPSRHAENLYFTAVDINGIHKTRIRFCMCKGESRVDQLMHARLFPATITQPATAFTFAVLHNFHTHHLMSKESAHDYISSLRHLTDNAFPQHVKDIAPQFRMVMRIWRLLKASKRSGDGLGIEKLLPHRRTLIVHCPVCPDPRINMEDGWQDTPRRLSHLNQIQFTADGNHHSNRYLKNTDPDDISLFNGNAYFPNDEKYREYVKRLPKSSPEARPCDHLTALNSQDRKKFKNMDITGIVMISCGHILIKSTVDLQLGEKFANTDYALAHAICNTKPADPAMQTSLDHDFATKIDKRGSYDIACGYGINAKKRFIENFPKEVDFVGNTKWSIPLLHVQNHRDNCTYSLSTAYHENAGHFQGETAEQPWIELNQLAPQTRQMNNGHRQDTIIDHNSHWNWEKTITMAATLYQDITRAKILFEQKHAAFKGLCVLYSDKLPFWNTMDRNQRTIGKDKEIQCVYRQYSGDVPSRSRIYQALISELSDAGKIRTVVAPLASFLNEGITLMEEQRKIHALDLTVRRNVMKIEVTRTQASRNKASDSELQSKRTRLEAEIVKWRKKQKSIAPQLGDLIIEDAISGKSADKPENQTLFMPSDLTHAQRKTLGLEPLGNMEYKLQEGIACDAIQKLRTIVKVHGALVVDKITSSKGQKQNTRSNSQIEEVASQRDQAIAEYMAARRAMVKLGGISEDSTEFRPLTIQDTLRKSTHCKRALGDSRRSEGVIWTNTSTVITHPGTSSASRSSVSLGDSATALKPVFGTQLVTTKPLQPDHKRGAKGKKRRLEEVSSSSEQKASDVHQPDKGDGWIWSFRPRQGMSDKDVEEWLNEGDRVQWFRAEAEMQRWQEEWEIKKAEFLRCIRSYQFMSHCWMDLSKTHSTTNQAGRASYAKRQAAMYRQMETDAIKLLEDAGYGELLSLKDNKALVEHIQTERLKAVIPELEPQVDD